MFRRNGKPRSCEPCRISKIRCDHATPTCEKCKTRGITEQCFYHPAPMTRPPGVPRKKPEPRRRAGEVRQNATRDHGARPSLSLSPTALRNDVGAPGIVNAWPTPPESATRTTQNMSEAARSFYLGSTSYASVFAGEEPLPNSLHEQPLSSTNGMPTIMASGLEGTSHCRMSIGSLVLSKCKQFRFMERLVRAYFKINSMPALIGPLVTSALPQMLSDLDYITSQSGNIYPLLAEITKNSCQPLKVPPTMLPSEFHTLWTGPNLRWEALGLIMALAASCAQFSAPDDPLFTLENGDRVNKDEFIEDMIHATNDCITLCQIHGAVNDIMVWLLYNNLLVQSNFYGDNYHGVWRRNGDTISALHAEGIHCENAVVTPSEEPLFLRESRRRIYAAVYRSDKSLADFFGRPPMIHRRYSDRGLPLDIDDEIAASDDTAMVNEAISKLDNDGWATDNQIRSASWIRLRVKLGHVKERFLEASLAGKKDAFMIEDIEAIREEHQKNWETSPAHLKYDTYDNESVWRTLEPNAALRMISAYLDHLHAGFQIQRLLHRHTQTALPALLEIAMNLLSTALIFNKSRSKEYHVQRHFATLVLFYCLPSAGVLALELRRCTLENKPLPSTVSRADIIRNLSVLISCVEWAIVPDDGNHRLCAELNKMIALVLDEVLNYQPPSNEGQDDGAPAVLGGVGAGFFDIPMIDGMEPIPTESEDFLTWLDNANWNNTYLF
ncbi:hypothetical protein BU23DRAFT_510546 [Bimuria novae-zelandiae CBS 107.79]|uniref:Zn(2)-C6 fungal-type domain-containing protein n=1 Tax=Bimuria novae-zelandiae CBS 107.79 TaxID=1447943 RepID=A0A6A5V1T9_9PLEO|nr:hypothetical protein BU23DRAFT_510546 [Bimuria novae-zelandiae CBS 107.79]